MLQWVVLGLLMICSCEHKDASVSLSTVPKEQVLAIARMDGQPADKDFEGYTLWDGQGNCDIYIVPKEFYADEWSWNALLGHEVRHCFEGDYHD